nr:uncharacterized protein LOC115867201 [Globicephala melas]
MSPAQAQSLPAHIGQGWGEAQGRARDNTVPYGRRNDRVASAAVALDSSLPPLLPRSALRWHRRWIPAAAPRSLARRALPTPGLPLSFPSPPVPGHLSSRPGPAETDSHPHPPHRFPSPPKLSSLRGVGWGLGGLGGERAPRASEIGSKPLPPPEGRVLAPRGAPGAGSRPVPPPIRGRARSLRAPVSPAVPGVEAAGGGAERGRKVNWIRLLWLLQPESPPEGGPEIRRNRDRETDSGTPTSKGRAGAGPRAALPPPPAPTVGGGARLPGQPPSICLSWVGGRGSEEWGGGPGRPRAPRPRRVASWPAGAGERRADGRRPDREGALERSSERPAPTPGASRPSARPPQLTPCLRTPIHPVPRQAQRSGSAGQGGRFGSGGRPGSLSAPHSGLTGRTDSPYLRDLSPHLSRRGAQRRRSTSQVSRADGKAGGSWGPIDAGKGAVHLCSAHLLARALWV